MTRFYIFSLFIYGYLVSIKFKVRRFIQFYKMYIIYCKYLNKKLVNDILNLDK